MTDITDLKTNTDFEVMGAHILELLQRLRRGKIPENDLKEFCHELEEKLQNLPIPVPDFYQFIIWKILFQYPENISDLHQGMQLIAHFLQNAPMSDETRFVVKKFTRAFNMLIHTDRSILGANATTWRMLLFQHGVPSILWSPLSPSPLSDFISLFDPNEIWDEIDAEYSWADVKSNFYTLLLGKHSKNRLQELPIYDEIQPILTSERERKRNVILPECFHCRETDKKMRKCEGCRLAFYCSDFCRRADYEHHQTYCHRHRRCSVCGGKVGIKVCMRCRKKFYCSKRCQAADWKTHRDNCVHE